jgi:hypothetical protein
VANISFQIPDTQLPRVIEALCAYQMVDAVTKADPTPALAKKVIIDWIKEQVKRYEEEKARVNLPPVDLSNIIS